MNEDGSNPETSDYFECFVDDMGGEAACDADVESVAVHVPLDPRDDDESDEDDVESVAGRVLLEPGDDDESDECSEEVEVVVDYPTPREIKKCLLSVCQLLNRKRMDVPHWSWADESVRWRLLDLVERL